ncbi:MAG: hypothetical protein JW797_02080 [Bradymonadales bacterium]|nr:hypothetical protein [Bradymonadales bacterium]
MLITLVLVCWAPASQAKEPWRPSAIFDWIAAPPEVQLEADSTPIPEGQGAIFLPSMTGMSDEPEVAIYSGRSRVATGSFGTRIIVAPGQYMVRVGSGSLRQTLSVPVEVRPDETTLVAPVWGGLRIEVVNANQIPHRGGYELIQLESRDIFGVGYGADTLVGERLQTWILPPGLYRVVQPGATYRSRTNFATVYVPPGALVRYQLVMDPDTNEFLGAGIVTAEQMSVPEGKGANNWIVRLILGLNGSLAVAQNMAGTPDQTSLSGEGSIDASVGYHSGAHHFVSLLQIEEGVIWINPEASDALPLQKSRDRFRLDLLYTYNLWETLGPYARASLRMNLFPWQVITTEEINVTRRHTDGSTETEVVLPGSAFETSDYLGEVLISQGMGINWRVLQHRIGQLDIGLGIGFRQNLYRDFYVKEPTSEPPDLLYNEVSNFNQEGLEAIVTGSFRLIQFTQYTTHFELFADFGEFTDPTIEWQNTLGIRLLEFLSLDYRFELISQPQVSEELQMAHNLLLRFSWELL